MKENAEAFWIIMLSQMISIFFQIDFYVSEAYTKRDCGFTVINNYGKCRSICIIN